MQLGLQPRNNSEGREQPETEPEEAKEKSDKRTADEEDFKNEMPDAERPQQELKMDELLVELHLNPQKNEENP